MLESFFLLSSYALFRHKIQHHIRCQQLPYLQRLSLVFIPSSQSSTPGHQESAPALSAFSSNLFPLHNSAAAYLQHLSIMVIPITSPEDHSVQAFLIYVVIFCFNHLLEGWPTTSCWGVSRRARGSNHHPLLHNKWACWASVPILVNANRKKRKLQAKRLRIIYAWITGGKLSHNWMTARKDSVSFSGYTKLWCSPVYNTGLQKSYRAHSSEFLQMLQLCRNWVKSSVDTEYSWPVRGSQWPQKNNPHKQLTSHKTI